MERASSCCCVTGGLEDISWAMELNESSNGVGADVDADADSDADADDAGATRAGGEDTRS